MNTYNYIAASLGTRDTTIHKPEYLYEIKLYSFPKTPNIVNIVTLYIIYKYKDKYVIKFKAYNAIYMYVPISYTFTRKDTK